MLSRRETMLLGALLAPMQKPAQASTQLQELRVLLLGQIIMHTGQYIVPRYRGTSLLCNSERPSRGSLDAFEIVVVLFARELTVGSRLAT